MSVVDKFFDYTEIPKDRKVKLIAYKLREELQLGGIIYRMKGRWLTRLFCHLDLNETTYDTIVSSS